MAGFFFEVLFTTGLGPSITPESQCPGLAEKSDPFPNRDGDCRLPAAVNAPSSMTHINGRWPAEVFVLHCFARHTQRLDERVNAPSEGCLGERVAGHWGPSLKES